MTLDFLSAARDIIAIDSRSSLSSGAVTAFLAPLCRAAGLEVRLQRERRDGVEQFNLIASRPGAETGSLLLATHLDTVPPGDPALWTVSGGRPFTLTQRDGDLYGLGCADVKLDFLCKLAALERLRGDTLRRPVVLAGTYGEEVGRFGAKLLVRELDPLPAMALVGEPTALQACPSHKGYAEVHLTGRSAAGEIPALAPLWRLRFQGVPAHSSQPDRGVSAGDLLLDAVPALLRSGRSSIVHARAGEIVNMVAPVAELVIGAPSEPYVPGAEITPGPDTTATWAPALVEVLNQAHRTTAAFRQRLATWTDDAFRPPYGTVNNGVLRLDADSCEYVCDVRLLPGDEPQAAFDDYVRRLRGLQLEGVTLTLETRFATPPFAARHGSVVLDALRDTLAHLGLPPTDEIKSGTTEAPVYAQAGSDAVVFGPGVATGNIHKPNERVPLAHLRTAIDVYEGVVRRLCL